MTENSDRERSGLGPAWLSAIAALITAIVSLVAFLASRSTPDAGSAATSPSASAATSTTTSRAVVPPRPSRTGGRLLTHYRVDVSSGYGINFGSSPARPVPQSQPSDLNYDADLAFFSLHGDGQIAVLSADSASFSDCKDDTRYTDQLTLDPVGEIICFTGHGVVAAAKLSGRHTDPTDVVTFDVQVWQDTQS
ncbi:MAG TPA: hypothetical protein VJX10_11620 [Pseudonocardiaceae bacterium]|nr:hypothetical protein [Pseudonocardiaceae bacterium]